MTEPGKGWPEPRVEVELRALADRLDVPPAPDLTGAVRSRLEHPSPLAPWARRVAAAVIALLVACAALAASPQVRAGVAGLLHVGGVEISPGHVPTHHRAERLPRERHVTLAEARRLAGFPVRVPSALGPPDAVTVSGGTRPRVVSFIYRAGPGRPPPGAHRVAARLDEFDGTVGPVLRKWVAIGQARPVRVEGHRGVWVRGPHAVTYVDRHGLSHTEEARLAGNTLIWQVGRVTLRLEGEFTRAEAIAVARSVG